MKDTTKIQEFVDFAKYVFNSNASDEIKYKSILGLRIFDEAQKLGISFDWHNPQTKVEENVEDYLICLFDDLSYEDALDEYFILIVEDLVTKLKKR